LHCQPAVNNNMPASCHLLLSVLCLLGLVSGFETRQRGVVIYDCVLTITTSLPWRSAPPNHPTPPLCSTLVYSGPVKGVQAHFEAQGFVLPPRMDLPSWLGEITTPTGRKGGNGRAGPHPAHPVRHPQQQPAAIRHPESTDCQVQGIAHSRPFTSSWHTPFDNHARQLGLTKVVAFAHN
jgi:hypothetical protein